jgi:hypothetical protein
MGILAIERPLLKATATDPRGYSKTSLSNLI